MAYYKTTLYDDKHNIKATIGLPGWAQAMLDNGGQTGDPIKLYNRVPQLFRAVQLRAQALSSVPFIINAGNRISDWPFPQPLATLLYELESSLMVAGAAYALKQAPKIGGNRVVGIEFLQPATISTTYHNKVIQFTQQVRGERFGPWGLDRMLYMREFSFSEEIGAGLAPARVALPAAQLRNSMQEFASGFFASGAQPMTLITMQGNPPPSEVERTEAFFKRAMQGVRNAWRVLALRSEVSVMPITPLLNTMAMPELQMQTAREIAAAFGIPLSLLTSDSTSYATAQSDQQLFYEGTIKPRLLMYETNINKQVLEPMGMHLTFQPESLTIYQQNEAERSGALGNLTSAGIPLRQAMLILGYAVEDVMATGEAGTGAVAGNGEQPLAQAEAVIKLEGIDAERAVNMCGSVSRGESSAAVVRIALIGMGFSAEQAESMVTDAAAFKPQAAPVPAESISGIAKSAMSYVSEAHIEQMQNEAKAWGRVAAKSNARALLFECRHIPPELEANVKARLAAQDPEWMHALEGIDIKALRLTTPQEKKLAGAVSKIFKEHSAAVINATARGKVSTDTLDAMFDTMAGRIAPILKSIFADELFETAKAIGQPANEEQFESAAMKWSDKYSFELVKELNATTKADVRKMVRRLVQDPSLTPRDVASGMYKTFSRYRVNMIATTEVTRAKSAAINEYQTELDEEDIKSVKRWRADEDELTCYICAPLDGKFSTQWGVDYAEGPPAHPNCRCRILLQRPSPNEGQ